MKKITPRDWAVIGAVKKSLYGNMAMDEAGRIDLPAIFVSASAAARPERLALFAKTATQAFIAGRQGLALDADPPNEEDVNKVAQDADDPDMPDDPIMDEDAGKNQPEPNGEEGEKPENNPDGQDEDPNKDKDEMMGKDEAMRMIDQAKQELKAQMAVDQANLRKAEKLVRNVYGDMALDSAEAIYDSVLKNAGIAFDQSFPLAAKEALVTQHINHKTVLKQEKPISMGMDQVPQSELDRLGISAFQGGTR